jgi:RNA polymerase I-specific transcription initiation factor RRN3
MPSIAKPPVSRRNYHARHHLLLAHLLSLIPTLPSVIQPLLAKHFPNKREAEVAQTTWVRNCCELIGYCPELGQRVWSQIVDRMLRIDVSRLSASWTIRSSPG